MDVSIIIPVYNEENTIKETSELFIKTLSNSNTLNFEIIFVNDCSTDNSELIITSIANTSNYVKLINHTKNSGKGAALKTGIYTATGKVILFGDADLELDPRQCLDLLNPLLISDFDIINGSRYLNNTHTKNYRSFINKIYGQVFYILTNKKISDFACGYKAIKQNCIKQLNLNENGFGIEAELMMKACKQKLKILEVPVTYNQRAKSAGKKLNNLDAIKILFVLFKHAF